MKNPSQKWNTVLSDAPSPPPPPPSILLFKLESEQGLQTNFSPTFGVWIYFPADSTPLVLSGAKIFNKIGEELAQSWRISFSPAVSFLLLHTPPFVAFRIQNKKGGGGEISLE